MTTIVLKMGGRVHIHLETNESNTTSDDLDKRLIFRLKFVDTEGCKKVLKLSERFSMELELKMIAVCAAQQ